MIVTIGSDEHKKRRLSPANIKTAVESLLEEGFVILENAVSHYPLEVINEKLDEMTNQFQLKQEGKRKTRIVQNAPASSAYIFREVVANPFVANLSTAVLGKGVYNNLYSVNTNCPASTAQPVHRDSGHLWTGMEYPHPIASLMINIGFDNISKENGAIQLWPGTHLDPEPSLWIPLESQKERERTNPPIYGETQKGSILIRDMRLWHRGMPNYSKKPRHMLSMSHHIYWLERGIPLQLPKESEPEFRCDSVKAYFDFR